MAIDRKLEKLVANRDYYKYKYDTCYHGIGKDDAYRKWKNAYDELTRYMKKTYPERYLQQAKKSKELALNKKPEVRMGDWCETFEEYGD